MSDARSFLLDALRRAVEGEEVTNDELLRAIPDPSILDQIEKDAWYRLSHWLDDGDIRERDSAYEEWQEKQIADALADLQALEGGFAPQEVEWGDHQAPHLPAWGCLLILAAIGLAIFLLLRLP